MKKAHPLDVRCAFRKKVYLIWRWDPRNVQKKRQRNKSRTISDYRGMQREEVLEIIRSFSLSARPFRHTFPFLGKVRQAVLTFPITICRVGKFTV